MSDICQHLMLLQRNRLQPLSKYAFEAHDPALPGARLGLDGGLIGASIMRLRHYFATLLLALAATLANGVAAAGGQTVETEEGIAYALPDGWSLQWFSKSNGSTMFIHKPSGANLLVSRRGIAGKKPDPHAKKLPLANGRTLEWQYSGVEMPGSYTRHFLVGRVSFPDAYIEMSATRDDMKTRVPENIGLPAMRQIAETVSVTGPRRCWGSDCKLGVVKDNK